MGKRKKTPVITKCVEKLPKTGYYEKKIMCVEVDVGEMCYEIKPTQSQCNSPQRRRQSKTSNNPQTDTSSIPPINKPSDGDIYCGDSMILSPLEGDLLRNNDTGNKLVQPLRTSARVLKKLQREASPHPVEKNESKPTGINHRNTKPKRRPWELWSVEDKNTFFEALNHHGKDFEAIQVYFANKMKKRALPKHMEKKKDQVRHFYYRTWHKISKYLDFPDESPVKKSTFELYALINYGELRRKMRNKWDDKCGPKLKELVYQGWTNVRIRGRTVRVRTPLCKALKKLNVIEDPNEFHQAQLPKKLTVELRPQQNADWVIVQSTAQNPRVRVVLTLQRRLATIIRHLENKWQPLNTKRFQCLMSSTNEISTVPEPTKDFQLRLFPKAGTPISLLRVKAGNTVTSRGLCLRMHEERIVKHPSDSLLNESPKRVKRKRKNSMKERMEKSETAVISEEEECIISNNVDDMGTCVMNDTEDVLLCNNVDDCAVVFKEEVPDVDEEEPHVLALRQLLALQQAANPDIDTDDDVIYVEEKSLSSAKNERIKEDDGEEMRELITHDTEEIRELELTQVPDNVIQKVYQGWTAEEAGTLTLGELYLMIGSRSTNKIILEYSWEQVPDQFKYDKTNTDNTTNDNSDITDLLHTTAKDEMIISVLQMLVSAANKVKLKNPTCPCGHSCPLSPSSGNKGMSSPSTSKTGVARSNRNIGSKIGGGKPGSSQLMIKIQNTELSESPVMLDSPPIHSPPSTTLSAIATKPAPEEPLAPSTNVTIQPSPTTHDGLFRRPLIFPSSTTSNPPTSRSQVGVQKIMPPFCNRTGRRGRRGQVVVQRVLPLLPKVDNTAASKGAWKVIPNFQQPKVICTGFVPIPITTITSTTAPIVNKDNVVNVKAIYMIKSDMDATTHEMSTSPNFITAMETHKNTLFLIPEVDNSTSQGGDESVECIPDLYVPESTPANSIPSFLHVSLSNGSETEVAIEEAPTLVLSESAEKMLDVALGNSNYSLSGLLSTPNMKLLPPNEQVSLDTSLASNSRCSTPPSSPSRILKDTDNQWLHGEVVDFSLSSLLGHFESPVKSVTLCAGVPSLDENRSSSSELDTQFHSLMVESSVDYTAKFADLAAQIAAGSNVETPKKK